MPIVDSDIQPWRTLWTEELDHHLRTRVASDIKGGNDARGEALKRYEAARLNAAQPPEFQPFFYWRVTRRLRAALAEAPIEGWLERGPGNQAAGRACPAPLTSVTFFDRYQGKGVAAGSVSLSVRLTFQADDRTLTDTEVQQSVDAILTALRRAHGAVQR